MTDNQPVTTPVSRLTLLTESLGAATQATIFAAAEKIKALTEAEAGDCRTLKIAIAGSLTTSFMARSIIYALGQEGVRGVVYEALYGSYIQEILDPSSGLHRFEPDLVLIALDWRDVVTDISPGADAETALRALQPKLAMIESLWSAAAKPGSAIIQQTIVPPSYELSGLVERTTSSGEYWQVNAFNQELIRRGRGHVTFLDIRILADAVGLKNWAPDRLYIYGKLPFDSRFMPDYAQLFRTTWRGMAGREKKCLVLDLDNTLWGGVIGDDGIEGIKIGPGSMVGEAFAEWARYILRLKQRGIVLAVCSKNDPAIASKAFDHPGSLLKLDDFAAFVCSWDDKAQGLRKIAASLNLGLDSLVFCDDNPMECALIRKEVPEIAVVDLGDDPTDFIRRLEAGYWFFRQSLTAEDAGRAAAYAARRASMEAQESATDLDGFLRGLKMTGEIRRPTDADMERLAQMEGKTNQFNLMTPRFNEAQIRAFAQDPDNLLYAVSLSDVHGQHGIIASLIAVREGDAFSIKSWLMSCRVFSRGVEQFLMARLAEDAREAGAARLIGHYRKTEKNGVVADLFERLGFHATAADVWELDLDTELELASYIAAA